MNLKQITLTLGVIASTVAFAQDSTKIDNQKEFLTNSAQNILNQLNEQKITLGSYSQIDYNQPLTANGIRKNGKLDVHRLITLLGYKFNERTKFITEIEYEHVKEVYIEQAFVDYSIKPTLSLRAGLLLIPMGITNEYHEPTTFNGVERTSISSAIVPTTWRELGLGLTGRVESASLKYQVYMVNGFLSYDGKIGKIGGAKAFRSGRQKAAESTITTPNLSAKVDYYGINGLKLGLAGYFGETQSAAYNNLNIDDAAAVKSADSTIVGLAMVGLDARYKVNGLEVKGEMIIGSISNSDQYNAKAMVEDKNGVLVANNMGSQIYGGYIEVGYNVLQNCTKTKNSLVPFVRYENYDTNSKMEFAGSHNPSYRKYEVVAGIGFKPAKGVVFKGDLQYVKDGTGSVSRTVNFGVGTWF